MKPLNIFFTLASAALLTSCFTEGYDLGQVDGSIGSDVDITLPRSSSGPIELRSVLHLEQGGLLKIVKAPDGSQIYAISEQGTHEAHIDLGSIKAQKPTMSDFEANLYLSMPHHQLIESTVSPDYVYTYTIGEGQAIQQWSNEGTPRISADVVRIDHIEFYDNELRMQAKVEGLESITPYAHLDGLVLHVPADIHFKSARINGHEAKQIERGAIRLTDEVEPRRFALGALNITLVLDTVRTGHDLQLMPEHHCISFKGQMELTGSMRITGQEILEYHPTYATEPALIPERVRVTGHSEFYSDLIAKSFTGRVRREVGPTDVEINNIPGLLLEEGVVVDLTEPMLFATVTTPLDAEAEVRASVSTASLLPEKCTTPSIKVVGSGKENNFYLGCHPAPKYYPLNTPEKRYSDYQYLEVAGLRKLLQNILKDRKVTLEVEPIEAECRDIQAQGSHKITATQEVLVPLSFGEDFRFVYQGTMMGLNLGSGVSGINLSDDAVIEIAGEVTNTLPIGALLTIDLIASDSIDLREVVEFANVGERPESAARHGLQVSAGAERQPFKFVVRALPGHNLLELLNPGPAQLNGIHYHAETQKIITNEALHPDSHLSIDNVLIHVRAKAEM